MSHPKKAWREKKLIVFDLDGTLTESKSPITRDMSRLLIKLLEKKMVAIISGGRYEQFQKQFLKNLKCSRRLLADLYLFPTSSTSFYLYKNGWKKMYAHDLSGAEKKKIFKAFEEAFGTVHYVKPKRVYGRVIEDRGSQITFSALGQDVVTRLGTRGIRLKEEWGRTGSREKIARVLERLLPKFEVRRGGLTSIDVTRKGIDKGYGIRQIEKHLNIQRMDMLFVGDAIYPGGNDYAAVRTGVEYLQVSGPEETKKAIRFLII